jgi:hypothetical protein
VAGFLFRALDNIGRAAAGAFKAAAAAAHIERVDGALFLRSRRSTKRC